MITKSWSQKTRSQNTNSQWQNTKSWWQHLVRAIANVRQQWFYLNVIFAISHLINQHINNILASNDSIWGSDCFQISCIKNKIFILTPLIFLVKNRIFFQNEFFLDISILDQTSTGKQDFFYKTAYAMFWSLSVTVSHQSKPLKPNSHRVINIKYDCK